MNIVLLGAPGSGKGTQAEMLVTKFNLFYLQTGKIVRELADKDARIAAIYNSGKLLPEEEMTMYVVDYLTKNKSDLTNILFEGFPRFVSQYEALNNYLGSKGATVDLVISLDISEQKAIERLAARRICQKCGEVYNLITNPPPKEGKCKCGGELMQRSDDHPEAIKVRFDYYYANTEKLINFLADKGKLVRVNGEGPITEIHEQIVSHINRHTSQS